MALMDKAQLKEFIKTNNIKSAEDIQAALKDLFKDTLQEMLEAELDSDLGYTKHDDAGKKTENRRNGHSRKMVCSEYGELEIDIPRDREGDFEPSIVKKYQKNVAGIEDQILALYAKGVSTRDIQDHLNQLYGVDVSPALISNVTNKIMPLIKEWQSRPLHRVYGIVFLDAIHHKVRQEGHIVSKAVYMCVGVDLDGNKDVLGMWIGKTESSKFWLTVLNDLRNRGVLDILIVSVDNTVASETAALAELDGFEQTWGDKYPFIVKSWRNNWSELSTFFKYSPEIRKLIYTTNMIESYHRQLRKVTKGKSIFPNDDALLKMLYLATQDVTRKWTGRIQNWDQILLQLSIYFPDKVQSHLV